jgi:hypothetical protein
MQLRLDRTRALAGLAALGVTFVLVAIIVAPRSRGASVPPVSPASPGTCADLARDVDPATTAVDSGYDVEKNLVYAHHAGRTYVLKPDDPVCRGLARSRDVIDHTLAVDRENTAVACAVMRDIVGKKRTQFRGRAVNQAAAQRFLARRCGGAQP